MLLYMDTDTGRSTNCLSRHLHIECTSLTSCSPRSLPVIDKFCLAICIAHVMSAREATNIAQINAIAESNMHIQP